MKLGDFKEVGAIAVVGIVVFGWVFGQSPLPDTRKPAATASKQTTESTVGKRGDQIPSVARNAPSEIKITIEPVAMAAPDQALVPAEDAADLLEVIATNLKMRSGPSSTTDMVSIYERGSTLEKIGQDGKWLQVRSTRDGTTGWMFADYLQSAN